MRAYQIFTAVILFCRPLFAADMTNSVPAGKILVEVIFTEDNNPPAQPHFFLKLYISEHKLGWERLIYNMDDQDGESTDADAERKATECIKLLKPLEERKSLPDSPTRIVTFFYAEGDKIITKRFPVDAVPVEIRRVLKIMGCDDQDCSRLKFVEKTQ